MYVLLASHLKVHAASEKGEGMIKVFLRISFALASAYFGVYFL
jgi:hypothetical protein